MLEQSFDSIFLETRINDKDLKYWRNKIEKDILRYGSRDRNRTKSCEFVYDLPQLNIMFKQLQSEQTKLKKKLQNQENYIKNLKYTKETPNNSIPNTNASTPLSKKSIAKSNDVNLITFGPGANWSENSKPKRVFPREVFTNRKLF